MKTKLGLILSMFLLALGFQNCSKAVEFSTGTLVAKDDPTANMGNNDINNYDDVIPGDEISVPDNRTIDNSHGNSNGNSNSNSNSNNDSNSNDESDVSQSGDHSYVCIIDGPGNSVKIGYVNGALSGKNATPQDVCMSERACNEIISQKILVKGPAARGFCPNKNPHVVEMSDEQIQALVDAL